MTTETEIMNDKEKTFFLAVALAATDTLLAHETPKSARYTRVYRMQDQILRLMDVYRPEAWPTHLVNMAASLIDDMNDRIKREFGNKINPPPPPPRCHIRPMELQRTPTGAVWICSVCHHTKPYTGILEVPCN